MSDLAPIGGSLVGRVLFERLEQVPPHTEWLANLANPCTRRAYRADIEDFFASIGAAGDADLGRIQRGHVLHWRRSLEHRGLAASTIRRKLAAVASLYDYLCDRNAVAENPAKGVRRPRNELQGEGKTPALTATEARRLLEAPDAATLKGRRDRALLAVALYQGLRRQEIATLTLNRIVRREGYRTLEVLGKGGKIRYVPMHPVAQAAVDQYLEQRGDVAGDAPLFETLHRGFTGQALSPDGIYDVISHYLLRAGLADVPRPVHAMRATAATNALEHDADIAKVQEMLGHANISTTKVYDRRTKRLSDSAVFKVAF